ncbi:potassium/proton antiporter [uncultured Friedmanniella sp.]|uniref:potassium/proton antiporter n=1 Tax=uncultured Friedmanniella sp. TaxID=335381 RepID=UPI0035CC91FA
MDDAVPFAELVLLLSVAAVAAILSNRLTARVRLPAPALFLGAAALGVAVLPGLHMPPEQTVERIVTLALLCILFDGGMSIGVRRFRAAAGPIAMSGVVGTFLTTGAAAVLIHTAFGFSWYLALLIGTAVAPTDPAVVFSVLGQQEIAGRSATIVEGESGANDPVGIALLISLLTAGSLSGGAVLQIGAEFVLQIGVGAVVGVLGGRLILGFMRRVSLPSEGLYPLRTLACVFALFGATTLLHGSGFLAVFLAGVVIGDERAPFKREIQRFHTALASLGEIVAFVVLGLTVDLHTLARTDVWVPGVLLGLALALVIRPVLVGLCLLPARLEPNERAFVLFAGLKGAVPILLGSFLLAAGIPGAERAYGIVVVVVAFSVVVQGSLVTTVARRLRLPVHSVPPQPWSLGVRLAEEPEGVLRLTVEQGSAAEGCTVDEVADTATDPGHADDVWFSMLVRDQSLVAARGSTSLRAGDELLVTAEDRWHPRLKALFRGSADGDGGTR